MPAYSRLSPILATLSGTAADLKVSDRGRRATSLCLTHVGFWPRSRLKLSVVSDSRPVRVIRCCERSIGPFGRPALLLVPRFERPAGDAAVLRAGLHPRRQPTGWRRSCLPGILRSQQVKVLCTGTCLIPRGRHRCSFRFRRKGGASSGGVGSQTAPLLRPGLEVEGGRPGRTTLKKVRRILQSVRLATATSCHHNGDIM